MGQNHLYSSFRSCLLLLFAISGSANHHVCPFVSHVIHDQLKQCSHFKLHDIILEFWITIYRFTSICTLLLKFRSMWLNRLRIDFVLFPSIIMQDLMRVQWLVFSVLDLGQANCWWRFVKSKGLVGYHHLEELLVWRGQQKPCRDCWVWQLQTLY